MYNYLKKQTGIVFNEFLMSYWVNIVLNETLESERPLQLFLFLLDFHNEIVRI